MFTFCFYSTLFSENCGIAALQWMYCRIYNYNTICIHILKMKTKQDGKRLFLLKIYTLPADKTKNNVFKATVPQKMHASNSKTVYTYEYGDSCWLKFRRKNSLIFFFRWFSKCFMTPLSIFPRRSLAVVVALLRKLCFYFF